MYCSNCGKEKTKVETGTYSVRTGEKIYDDVCIPCDKELNIQLIIGLILVIFFVSIFVFCGLITQ